MIVPCMVNSWLYCSLHRNCCPGRASSPRISSAIAPPIMKNANDVTRYKIAMSFGSVVRNMWARRDPLTTRRAGYGRELIGFGRGTVAVMATSDPAVRSG